jgi:hypothetical protein
MQPDQPGSGYATAYFKITIPYDTEGRIAYSLARTQLESEFIDSQIAWWQTSKYSPLRVRAGSNQPALSITVGGGLDGKFKDYPVPFVDTGFTERDWQSSDTDRSGKKVRRVIVGSLNFMAAAWPENVEGSTNISAGVAAGNAFLMVDHDSGQGAQGTSKIHVNLIENVEGEVSLGVTFSTNGGILSDADAQAFDARTKKERERFASEVERGCKAMEAAMEASANAPMY